MTCQPNNFNHNGMENIWSKFELRATFPVGATQSGDMKKYRIFSKSLSGGKPKIQKMSLGNNKSPSKKKCLSGKTKAQGIA